MSTETPTHEELEEKFGKGFADYYLSVDWEQITKDNALRDIGSELYANAKFLRDELGAEQAVGVAASIMENWWSSVPNLINRDVAQTIATGFAFAMVREATREMDLDEEDE